MDVIGSLIGLDQSAMLGGATHLLSALFPGTNLPVSTDSKGASPTSFAFLCVRAVVLGFVLNWVRKVYQYLLNRAQKRECLWWRHTCCIAQTSRNGEVCHPE